MRLEGKVAIVTGASRGIGEAIVRELEKEGATVIGCSRSTGVDVANAEQVNQFVKNVITEHGHIDILVNNAGITKDGLLMRMSDDDWDMVVDTNLKGTFLFTRAVSRPMMKTGGAIVNITSVVGITGNAGQANYTASKGGVIALTKTTAKELGSRNVRCNAIAPGFIESKMTEGLSDEIKAKCMEQIPLKRFGKVEDVAKAVAFLVSDDAGYITGQIISVNGGMV